MFLNVTTIIGEPEYSNIPSVTATSGSYDTVLNQAIFSGSVTADNGYTVTETGVYYSVDTNSTVRLDTATKVSGIDTGLGTFTTNTNITQTASPQTVYYRAYAVNSQGEGVSNNVVEIDIPAS